MEPIADPIPFPHFVDDGADEYPAPAVYRLAPPGVFTGLAGLDRRDLLNLDALARCLGVSERTVLRRVESRQLPRPVAGRLWFAGHVVDFLEAEAGRMAREGGQVGSNRKRKTRRSQ